MTSTPKQNGTLDAPIEISSVPTVVGINFGNSYASIAVLTKVSFSSESHHAWRLTMSCRKALLIASQTKMENDR